jgi:hypothetical protein
LPNNNNCPLPVLYLLLFNALLEEGDLCVQLLQHLWRLLPLCGLLQVLPALAEELPEL